MGYKKPPLSPFQRECIYYTAECIYETVSNILAVVPCSHLHSDVTFASSVYPKPSHSWLEGAPHSTESGTALCEDTRASRNG